MRYSKRGNSIVLEMDLSEANVMAAALYLLADKVTKRGDLSMREYLGILHASSADLDNLKERYRLAREYSRELKMLAEKINQISSSGKSLSGEMALGSCPVDIN